MYNKCLNRQKMSVNIDTNYWPADKHEVVDEDFSIVDATSMSTLETLSLEDRQIIIAISERLSALIKSYSDELPWHDDTEIATLLIQCHRLLQPLILSPIVARIMPMIKHPSSDPQELTVYLDNLCERLKLFQVSYKASKALIADIFNKGNFRTDIMTEMFNELALYFQHVRNNATLYLTDDDVSRKDLKKRQKLRIIVKRYFQNYLDVEKRNGRLNEDSTRIIQNAIPQFLDGLFRILNIETPPGEEDTEFELTIEQELREICTAFLKLHTDYSSYVPSILDTRTKLSVLDDQESLTVFPPMFESEEN